MFPGMGKINPAQIQRAMKQFGIKSEELEAERVIFELKGKKLVIENPSVTAIDMQGQKTYQVMGEAREESRGPPEEDVKMVMEQSGASREKSENALKGSGGDLAEAISKLKK